MVVAYHNREAGELRRTRERVAAGLRVVLRAVDAVVVVFDDVVGDQEKRCARVWAVSGGLVGLGRVRLPAMPPMLMLLGWASPTP